MEKAIIIRYGEIGIKSNWVRSDFEKRLINNISQALSKNDISIEKIKRERGRIYLWCSPSEKALKVLKNVFGIVSYSPAQIIQTDLEEMKRTALEIYKKSKKKKFRITTRRIFKKFPLPSMQISSAVGGYVVEKTGAKVDLTKYDIDINFEITEKQTFVFSESFGAWGGLPIGTQGKVLCVISDKTESWINAWQLARRGCELVFIGNKESKKVYEKFNKKYYHFKEDSQYIISDLSLENIRNMIKKEHIKAVVLCNKFVGKYEGQLDIMIFYPSIGHTPIQIKKLWKSIELD